ncbi:MAG: hypothetical protein J6A90_06280 [Clostridia bacterium]|nr:hypothetical protein [Clostridia bacterium]
MRLAEELVKLYDEGTLSASEAQRKLKALGYQTGITADNVLEVLDELIPELREYATSERAAYRAWRKKEDEAIIEDSKHLNSDNSHDEELIDRALKEVNGNNNSSATQNGTSKAPSPTREGEKAALRGDENVISSEEYARHEREAGWDYWLSEVDRREGSVRKLKNGKIKVGMAQTANEVKLTKFINNKIMDKAYSNENVKSVIDKILSNSDIWGH